MYAQRTLDRAERLLPADVRIAVVEIEKVVGKQITVERTSLETEIKNCVPVELSISVVVVKPILVLTAIIIRTVIILYSIEVPE